MTTMNTFGAIYGRRAVKHFDPDHEMPQDDLRKRLEAAVWRFVVVRDPELRRQIREHGNDQAQMTDASVLVVMTADVDAWKKDPERYRPMRPGTSRNCS